MAVFFVLALSIIFQVTAAYLALRLIRVTQKWTAWTLIASAVLLMAVRRMITFYRLISGDLSKPPDLPAELVALVISTLMVLGIALLAQLFRGFRSSEETLRRSADNLAKAEKIASLGNWDWNIVTNELLWSDEVYRIFDLNLDEFDATYEAFLNAVHPEDRQLVENAVEAALYENRPYLVEHRLLPVNGKERVVREQAEVTFDNKGKPVRMFGTVQDITESQQAEQALRESEEFAKSIVETSINGIYIYDLAKGSNIYLNPQYTKITGYTIEEINAFSADEFFALFHPDDQQSIAEHMEEVTAARDGEIIEIEYRFKSKGSDWRWLLSWDTVFERDQDGRVTQFMGAFIDVSERKQAEQARFLSEARMGAIMNIASEAIITVNEKQNITHFNQGAEDTFGYTVDEVLGRPLDMLLPDQLTEVHRGHINDFGKMEDRSRLMGGHMEIQGKRKDGSLFPADASISKLEEEGQTTFTAILRDVTPRKQFEQRIQSQMENLAALREIDMAITASLDLRVTLNVILDQVTARLAVDAASILLLNPRTQYLEYAASRGFYSNSSVEMARVMLGKSYAGHAALNRKTITIDDLRASDVDPAFTKLIADEKIVAYFGMPLIAKGQIKGVLEVFSRSPLDPDEEWLSFLEALGGQTAIALDNASLFDDLQRSNVELALAYDSTLEGWSRALDMRDKETEGHTQRVTEMTMNLASLVGMDADMLIHVRRGALLHDIGKMGIPDSILLKPAELNEEEWQIMKQHPGFAYDLLSQIDYLRPALDIPYCHHEKWDGTGYPRGLKGEQIPLAARIFAIVDVWDALNYDRPYRKAWPEDKIRAHIQDQSGQHFDPQIVEAFFRLLETLAS